MLLANMAKHPSIERLTKLEPASISGLTESKCAFDQLLDLFVKGTSGAYNPAANFDYLSYLFADLAQVSEAFARQSERIAYVKQHSAPAHHLLAVQSYDSLTPISKLLPFVVNASLPRRLGVAATIKNVSLLAFHDELLDPPLGVLPAVMRPLMSGEDNYSEDENDKLPDELQFLEPDAKRETDASVTKTHLETLLALTGTRRERDALRDAGVYYVVRECHLAVQNEGVQEACDKLVQVLMRDEEGDKVQDELAASGHEQKQTTHDGRGAPAPTFHEAQKGAESDEDDKIIEVL